MHYAGIGAKLLDFKYPHLQEEFIIIISMNALQRKDQLSTSALYMRG